MQYSSAIEKNEVLTEATKRMDVESMMQSERRPLQKTTQRMIPIKQTPQRQKVDQRLSRAGCGKQKEWEMTADGHRASFQGDENALNQSVVAQLCEYTKTRELLFVVQSLSCLRLFVTLWTVILQAPWSFTVSQSLLKFTPIEPVMPSNHLLCRPFFFCL